MTPDELKNRTKAFAVRVIRLADSLPQTAASRAIVNQLVRSGTSVAANYRSACRAKSAADFANKMSIVEEEADETAFWIELLVDAGLLRPPLVAALLKEARELTAISVASIRTVRGPRKAGARRVGNPQSEIRNSDPGDAAP